MSRKTTHQDLLERAKRRGLLPSEELKKVTPGAVFLLDNKAVHFPTDRLSGAGAATSHPVRWAVVVQAEAYSASERPKTVLVVPCSSSGEPDVGDYPMPQEELNNKGPFSAPKVTAYVTLLQPCLKSDLVDYRGDLQDETFGALFARVARLLGLKEPALAIPLPPRLSAPAAPAVGHPPKDPKDF